MENNVTQTTSHQTQKRMRSLSDMSEQDANIAAEVTEQKTKEKEKIYRPNHKALHHEDDADVHNRLYADQVHHSIMGLDMAVKILHKFVAQKYDYNHFSFIFIHDLGCNFVAYDGKYFNICI